VAPRLAPAPVPAALPIPSVAPAPTTVTLRTADGAPATVSRWQGAAWQPVGVTPLPVPRPNGGQERYRVEASGAEPVDVIVDASSPTERAVTLQRSGRGHHRRDRRVDDRAAPAPGTSPAPRPGGNDGLRDPWN
jgi:hypothetical protein